MRLVFGSLLAMVALGNGGLLPQRLKKATMKQESILIKGKIKVGPQVFEVFYYDNPTSRSFVEQMPFTIHLEDYAQTEKVFHPKKPLDKRDTPKGAAPSKGDIMLYAPWGNVAIFYKDFPYSNGLVPIGHLADVSGFVEALAKHESMASFELLPNELWKL